MSGGNTLLERYQKGIRMRADVPRATPRPRRRLGGTRRERTDQEPTHDIAEDEGLARDPGEGATHHGRDEDVCQIAEENRVGAHGPDAEYPVQGQFASPYYACFPGRP